MNLFLLLTQPLNVRVYLVCKLKPLKYLAKNIMLKLTMDKNAPDISDRSFVIFSTELEYHVKIMKCFPLNLSFTVLIYPVFIMCHYSSNYVLFLLSQLIASYRRHDLSLLSHDTHIFQFSDNIDNICRPATFTVHFKSLDIDFSAGILIQQYTLRSFQRVDQKNKKKTISMQWLPDCGKSSHTASGAATGLFLIVCRLLVMLLFF